MAIPRSTTVGIAFVVVVLIAVIAIYVLLSDSKAHKTTVKYSNDPIIGSYFAMCTIAKNEKSMAEWIEYHRRLGCGKFYLYDDNSSVPLISSIEKYVTSGLVEYHFGDFSYYRNPQVKIYDLCLQNYRIRHKFIGFLDADEFLVVVNKSQKIPDVLKAYEAYGGVAVQWKLFGSSNHTKRPEGGVLKNYNKCCNNTHIKTIVNTRYGDHCGPTMHEFQYREKKYSVLTNHTKLVGPWNRDRPAYDVMYLNHYNIKSWEDFQAKIAKGRADKSVPFADPKSYFVAVDKVATEDCGCLEMPPDN